MDEKAARRDTQSLFDMASEITECCGSADDERRRILRVSFKAHIPVDRREKETPPMLRVVEKPSKENQELRETLEEVLQRGALRMLQEMLEAETRGLPHAASCGSR